MPPTGQALGGDTFKHLPTPVIPIIALTCTVGVQLVRASGVVAERQPSVTSGWVRSPDLGRMHHELVMKYINSANDNQRSNQEPLKRQERYKEGEIE